MKKLLFVSIGLGFALIYNPVLADKQEDKSSQEAASQQQQSKSKPTKEAQKKQRPQQEAAVEQGTGVTMEQPEEGSAFGNWKLKGNDY